MLFVKKRIVLFIVLLLDLCVMSILALNSMEGDCKNLSKTPLLTDQAIQSYDSFKEQSLFDRLPIELIDIIFRYCDPHGIGLNYLIHHYEPNQDVVNAIVRAKIGSLIGQFHKSDPTKDISLERARILDELLKFQHYVPPLHNNSIHKQCRNYLHTLFSLENYCTQELSDLRDFENELKDFTQSVKRETARLQWGDQLNSLEDLKCELFLVPEADEYLEIHHVYLAHLDFLLKKAHDRNPKKPLGWNFCLTSMNTASISFFSLNIFLLFFSTSADFEYKNSCIALGSLNALVGSAWMLWSLRMCKKSAIPGYRHKKNIYKKIQESIVKTRTALDVGPQDLIDFSVQEKENIV